jgi:hypothetical protein
MSKLSEPRVTEINVNVSGGGKLSLEEYGAESVSWSSSFSRRIAIPETWDAMAIQDMELQVADDLQALVDEKNQPEYEAAMRVRKF